MVCHQLTGKQKRKSASSSKVKVVFEKIARIVTRHIAEEAPNKLSEVNAFRSDESGGNFDAWPLLAVGYVDLISVGENLRGSTMETRKKAPSEILNEEEVNTEESRSCWASESWTFRRTVKMSCKILLQAQELKNRSRRNRCQV